MYTLCLKMASIFENAADFKLEDNNKKKDMIEKVYMIFNKI